MNAKRAHTKSRNGCDECKAKKVKCDERVPCTRCLKRNEKCSLVLSSTSGGSLTANRNIATTSTFINLPHVQNDTFTLTDIQLFHQFTTTTWRYIANDPIENSPWMVAVPTLATKHPFLLHEVLAIAAVDLSVGASNNDDDGESIFYLELARLHHARALAGLMPTIAAETVDLLAPIWACNALFVPYYFATTADISSLLFTTEPQYGPAEWMLPLRGAVTIFKLHEDALLQGPWGTHLKPYVDRCRDNNSYNPSADHITHMINQLQLHGQMTDEEIPVMMKVFQEVQQCFSMSDQGDMIGKKSASLVFCAKVPRELFEMLGRRRKAALVVMAYWCVLLNRVKQGKWWLSSKRVREMLAFLAGHLGPEARSLIQWPIDVIGLPDDGEVDLS